MSTKGRILGINIGAKSKKKSSDAEAKDQNSSNTDEGETTDSGMKMTKSSSLTSIPTSDTEKTIVDQNDIITLTQDVKCFSDGLNRLKTVFDEQVSPEDLRVTIHERLGEVLSILKNIIHQYPALQSTELFAASGNLITKVKSLNQEEIKQEGVETSLFEAIDQLALAFSSGVSDYLMGDMGSTFAEKVVKSTKSCDDLLSTKDEHENGKENEVVHLTPEEIDQVLSQLEAGVDVALQRAKAWSKYMKDITTYIERKAHLETEYSKNLARLAQTMRPVLTEEGFLPLQSVYCTVLSQDIEYANTCQATQILLQTSKFVEPLTTRRLEHDRMRKAVKEQWMKEIKKMHEAVQSHRKAQALYFQRQGEYEKAKEQSNKVESDMLNQSSSSALNKIDKRKKLEDDAMHRAAEAETTYKACVVEANTRKAELEKTKTELLAKIREQIFYCDQVIKNVTIEYFHLLQTVTAPVPVQYHTISETSKQYDVGFQYGEFVKRLPVTDKNSINSVPFAFEPYSRYRESGRKASAQSTGSGSSDHLSHEESPSFSGDRRDKYRVAVKAWPMGSDDDSASGSSKSSPSNSPYPSGRKTLTTARSLDELNEESYNGGGFLQIPPCVLKGTDSQGIIRVPGRRRNTTFGVDFQEQVEQWKSAVPPIVKKCLKEVEQRGITLKGIYRVSGVKSKVEGLCQRFEKDPDSIDLSEEHPNVISNVLKLYLRQLPEPLLTFKMYSDFIHLAKESVAGTLTLDDTIDKLGALVSLLPYSNFKTCGVLMYHLQRVASFNSVNQMTSSNLGIVFGPTLLRPLEGTASLASLVDTPHQTRTIELLIIHAQSIFGPETDYELTPGETPIEPISDRPSSKPDPTPAKICISKEERKVLSSPNSAPSISEKTVDQLVLGDDTHQSKTSDADFILPGSAHCNKKESVINSDGEENGDIESDDDLPEAMLPDDSQHVVKIYKGQSGMVLGYDPVRQLSSTLNESVQRSPPQELTILSTSHQPAELDQKRIKLPTITVIESSPIREYPPQSSFAASLAHTTLHSSPSHALAESHPLPTAFHDLQEEAKPSSPTIEALIKATKGTFSKEEFKPDADVLVGVEEKLTDRRIDHLMEESKKPPEGEVDVNEDTNNNAPPKPKPSDLPPLKTFTVTCPSSPLLQRHAQMQAQKEAESSVSNATVIHRNSPSKRSPPMFRTSLTEIGNKSKGADGTGGSLSPKLSRRFSGHSGSLLGSRSRSSSSLDSKDGSLSPATSLKSETLNRDDVGMEVENRSTDEIDLDMTVQSGMVDSLKRPDRKNVTFALNPGIEENTIETEDHEEAPQCIPISVSKSSDQSKPYVKDQKKKGPLGIVMGKAAIAARAVGGSQKNVSSSSNAKTTSAKSNSKSKHSHGQCVMGTSVSHSNRSGHVSCATCGRRRAASQTAVMSEPPTKQQAKGKQTPVRKSSLGSQKSPDTAQSSKSNSPRDDSSVNKPSGKKPKPERKPFFV